MSTSRVEARPFRPGDLEALLARGLRPADELEVRRVSGLDPYPAMRVCLHDSLEAFTLSIAGLPAALFGVGKEEGMGVPWLVGHEDFEDRRTAVPIMRLSLRVAAGWQARFGRLANLADPEHAVSIPYLERLGFTLEWNRPVFGPLGHRLVYFWR
jgi:hypothetical protein